MTDSTQRRRARKPIRSGTKVHVARRLGVIPDATPHPIRCAYCSTPGTITWWPPNTYRVLDIYLTTWRDRVYRLSGGNHITTTFEWDHIIPVRHGGTNDPDNLTLACQSCNTSKGCRTLDEWHAWMRTPAGRKRAVLVGIA